jgi:hypothetical protein
MPLPPSWAGPSAILDPGCWPVPGSASPVAVPSAFVLTPCVSTRKRVDTIANLAFQATHSSVAAALLATPENQSHSLFSHTGWCMALHLAFLASIAWCSA